MRYCFIVLLTSGEVIMEEVKFVSTTDYSHKFELEDRNQQKTSIFLYFTASTVTILANMTIGIMFMWISPAAPKLMSDDPQENPLSQPITTVQLSIIASLPAISFILGPLFLTNLFDKLGRRTALMILGIPTIVTMIAIAYATNIHVICIGITVNVFCLSAAYSGATIYLSEISEEHDRAKMACIGSCGMPLGSLMGYVFSSFTSSLRDFTLLSALPAGVCLVILFAFLPETPVHLVSKGRREEAYEALKKLRKKTDEALEEELRHIAHVIEITAQVDKTSFRTLYKDPASREALVIAVAVHSISFFCGAPLVTVYLEIIIDRVGTMISSDIATIFLTSVQLVSTGIATQVVGKFGRRTLLMSSTTICTIMLFSIGVFFCLKNSEVEFIQQVTWLPLVALIVFYISTAFGLSSVCWILASELFPNDIISAALSVIILCDGIACLVSIFVFPLVMEALGMHWNFFGLSMGCCLGFFYVYLKVPETRGKSLIDIRKMLIKG